MTQEVESKHKHSYSDEYRVQCAVRQLLIWRENWGLQKFRKYLSENKIDSKILNMVADQWQKGNKGEKDKWI
jgi:hypothetical protein